jgi:uncharacterized protein
MKVRSENIKFASRDALKLHGTLSLPSGALTGTMLMVHGITSDRSEWGIFDLIAKEVAADGIASLRFDYRGHGKSNLGQDKISLFGILSDVRSAWVELEKLIDSRGAKRRFMVGSSFGGGLAYAAASRIGSIDRAFLIAPVFDYLTDIDNCAPKWATELKRKDHFQYNDLALGRPLVNEAFYFDPLSGRPVAATIFHGTRDSDVSIKLSRKVAQEHPTIELIEVKGAGHVMNVPADYELEEEKSWGFISHMAKQIRERLS